MKFEATIDLKALVCSIIIGVATGLGMIYLFDNFFFIEVLDESGKLLLKQSVGQFMTLGAVLGIIATKAASWVTNLVLRFFSI